MVEQLEMKLKLPHEQEKLRKLLSQTFWNVDAAVEKYKEDELWQRKYADILCSFENQSRRPKFFHLDSLKTA